MPAALGLKVAVQPGRDVEKRNLQHVRGVDPALKARVQPQLDHAAQSVAVVLERVGRRLVVIGLQPFKDIEGFARIIRDDIPRTL
jgi:hypothetical protein